MPGPMSTGWPLTWFIALEWFENGTVSLTEML